MEDKCFRSTIGSIPADQSVLKTTAVPFFFSVEFEKNDVPVVTDSLIRCEKCKAYLNPHVEVIMPGFKWKCNLCENVNEAPTAFQMKERASCENPSNAETNYNFNKSHFVRQELQSDVYEIEAPESFIVKTPDPPVLCFIIEATVESNRLSVLSSVLNTIKEVLRANSSYDPRTKVSLMFFNEAVYVLNRDKTLSVYSGEIPFINCDQILHPFDFDDSSSETNIATTVEEYFAEKKSNNSNFLLALKIAIQAFRSGTIFSFVSSTPNFSTSKITPSAELVCKNNEYKTAAESLFRKNLCANLFVMSRSNIEFSTMKILAQQTGGQAFYYSNYDGADPVSSSKLYCDLMDYFGRNIGFGAVCRVRANEGVALNDIRGNFCQKGIDLLGYANFNPSHTLNFTIGIFSPLKKALYLQIAMIRVTKDGRRLIRVFNISIFNSTSTNPSAFYDTVDAHAIAHSLLLSSFYYEGKGKLQGSQFLQKSLASIYKEVKQAKGSIPQNLINLPLYILALKKSIPLRPDSSTPIDFRTFYMYLFSNSYIKVVDLMIYPLLLNLSNTTVAPIGLTMSNVLPDGFYLLDTGINIMLFIGKNCMLDLAEIGISERNSGPFLFNPPQNDFSNYLSQLFVFLMEGRPIKPRFILVNDREISVYRDVFLSYMYEDRMFQLPSISEFMNDLNK